MKKPTKQQMIETAEKALQALIESYDINCTGNDKDCPICPAGQYENSYCSQKWLETWLNENKEETMEGIVEINPKQCKRMLVWEDDDEAGAFERLVIARCGDKYFAIDGSYEKDFIERGIVASIILWKNAKPLPEKKTYTHKELEEKLGESFVYGGE